MISSKRKKKFQLKRKKNKFRQKLKKNKVRQKRKNSISSKTLPRHLSGNPLVYMYIYPLTDTDSFDFNHYKNHYNGQITNRY